MLPAVLICEYLKQKGIGANCEQIPAPQWSVYVNQRPDGVGVPDDIIAIRDTLGKQDGFVMGPGQPQSINHPGVQVVVRAQSQIDAQIKIKQIKDAMDQLFYTNINFNGYDYPLYGALMRNPMYWGVEQGNRVRHLFSVNGIVVDS